ncbi:MAG: universal stress protein [Hyphomicrobiaceae bacterium]
MFKGILVPIDVNQPSSWEEALPVAAGLAKANSAPLHIVNVVPTFGMPIVGGFFPEGFEKKALAHAKEALEKVAADANLEGVKTEIHVAHGTIYEEVIAAADKLDVDLIVMTAHRPELQDYLLGPNASRVVRHAKQSVFVVRQ